MSTLFSREADISYDGTPICQFTSRLSQCSPFACSLLFRIHFQSAMLIPRLTTIQSVEKFSVLGPVLLDLASVGSIPIPPSVLQSSEVYVGNLAIDQIETARTLLHDGALLALVNIPQHAIDSITEQDWASIPRDRLGARVRICATLSSTPTSLPVEFVAQLSSSFGAIMIEVAGLEEGQPANEQDIVDTALALKSKLADKKGKPVDLFVEALDVHWSPEAIRELHRAEIKVTAVERNSNDELRGLQEELLPVQAEVDAVDAFIVCLKSDRPDGLYATVVVDELSRALGLVYSAPESIRASVACRRGVYWSRSRNGLWRKGDSSGAWQQLLRLDMDCDSDALRVTVEQKGTPPAFCHLGRRDCWAKDSGLGALQRTLEDRAKAPPQGSYTSRLFNDPVLLRSKLVEEAQELSEAQEPDHIAAEAADLIYFTTVRCVAAGVGLHDIERHLNARTLKLARRSGDAKAGRIEVAEKILKDRRAHVK